MPPWWKLSPPVAEGRRRDVEVARLRWEWPGRCGAAPRSASRRRRLSSRCISARSGGPSEQLVMCAPAMAPFRDMTHSDESVPSGLGVVRSSCREVRGHGVDAQLAAAPGLPSTVTQRSRTQVGRPELLRISDHLPQVCATRRWLMMRAVSADDCVAEQVHNRDVVRRDGIGCLRRVDRSRGTEFGHARSTFLAASSGARGQVLLGDDARGNGVGCRLRRRTDVALAPGQDDLPTACLSWHCYGSPKLAALLPYLCR